MAGTTKKTVDMPDPAEVTYGSNPTGINPAGGMLEGNSMKIQTMMAAPEAPKGGGTAGKTEAIAASVAAGNDKPVNRFSALFAGGVTFKPTDTDKTYKTDDGKLASKKLASVFVMFAGGFAGVPGTIYLKQPLTGTKEQNEKARVIDFVFFGARQVSSITALDDAAKQELQAFKRDVGQQYKAWRAGQPKLQPGIKTQTAVDAGDLDDTIDLD